MKAEWLTGQFFHQFNHFGRKRRSGLHTQTTANDLPRLKALCLRLNDAANTASQNRIPQCDLLMEAFTDQHSAGPCIDRDKSHLNSNLPIRQGL